MLETLEELYTQSGGWGDPILIVSGLLFVAGWILMFTARMIKRFVYFTLLSLVLPNMVGFVGYLEEADTIQEAMIERGEDLTEEAEDAIEDMQFSPIYLSLIGSILAAMVGVAGIVRVTRKKRGAVGNS